jgi:DNA primase
MIEKERIEALKRDVDLVALVKSMGIDLKQNGKGYKGHCPFHDDQKTPSLSVTPSKQLWKCFGCGKGGDIFEFVQLFDRIDFKVAVAKLETYLPGADLIPKKAVKKKRMNLRR